MKNLSKLILGIACCSSLLLSSDIYVEDTTQVPDLAMKSTKLSFKEIQGYQNYKIVASHFRKDKNEIRYILANPVAYNALKESDGWGYARFIKKDSQYKAWTGDIQSCVSCHAIVKSNDALFTKFQRMF